MEIVDKKEVVTIRKYKAIDGTMFDSIEDCLRYERTLNVKKRKCDKCNGVGFVMGRWVEPFDNYDIGHIEGHHEWDLCPKCNGERYITIIAKTK